MTSVRILDRYITTTTTSQRQRVWEMLKSLIELPDAVMLGQLKGYVEAGAQPQQLRSSQKTFKYLYGLNHKAQRRPESAKELELHLRALHPLLDSESEMNEYLQNYKANLAKQIGM